MIRTAFCAALMTICNICFSAATIETIVGAGTRGDTGDGGPATAANLDFYSGDVATDGSGNVYISGNQRVRKISAGIISTPFEAPGIVSHVAATANGTVFFSTADVSTAKIWMATSNGVVSAVAGTGTAGYSGDGTSSVNAQIGANINALTTDSAGNLYFVDVAVDSGRIRKIDTAGIITTVAGGGSAAFAEGAQASSISVSTYALAVDSSGNIFYFDGALRKISNGVLSTIGGNGDSTTPKDGDNVTSDSFNAQGLAIDAQGNLYISDDTDTPHIWKIDSTGIIHAVAGSGVKGFLGDGGPATNASLNGPLGMAIDSNGNVVFADTANYRIRRVNSGTGGGSTQAGSLSALDSDADGFPDEIEVALGTNPQAASSTPFDGSQAGAAQTLAVAKLGVKLNFAKPGTSDSVTISGTLPVPDQFVVAGQQITVDVGGTIGAFTLNDKGTAALGSNSIKLTLKRKKGIVLAQNAKFSAKFLKAGFADRFTDEGLKNTTVKNASDTLPVVVLFNQQVFKSELPMLYTATTGKTGHTTQPR